jgi:phage baseplate assembly protein V
MSDPTDIQRLIGDVIRLGAVASVDLGEALCTVEIGDLITAPLPWLAGRAGATSVWSPPVKGEQVIVLCPEGDTEAGVVLAGLYSNKNPAPADRAELDLFKFPDGSTVSFDAEARHLSISLVKGTRMTIAAPAGLRIGGDAGVIVESSLTVRGNVSAGNGASGTFSTATGQVVMVQGGIITDIS